MKVSFWLAQAIALVLPVAGVLADPGNARDLSRGPILVSFEGGEALAVAVYRQRMLSRILHYTLTVDAEGNPTKCVLTPKFRLKVTRVAICRPLLKSMKFEPARDKDGNAIEGEYSDIIDMRTGIAPER